MEKGWRLRGIILVHRNTISQAYGQGSLKEWIGMPQWEAADREPDEGSVDSCPEAGMELIKVINR